jgi:glycosyltransferase involved in cell wall biosynthesis
MTSTSDESTQALRWVALLGQRDTPTDGVEDYCVFLGRALAPGGVQLNQVRVQWIRQGWIGALRQLASESAAWRGRWVLLQYTALSWSRRGFPLAALIVVAILRRSGARVAVVFHESHRQGGLRWADRIRGAWQDWVIQKMYRWTAKSIFTVPIDTISWLPRDEDKAAFIPIGANIPEPAHRLRTLPLKDKEKTVIVFGVTGAPEMASEVTEIAGTMREASKKLERLRLVVVGRGSIEAREQLISALRMCEVELSVRGVLPAEEISGEFERADALLFIRGTITPQRGSAIAAIACGIPIVGYRPEQISAPLQEAGVEWSCARDPNALAKGLVRVLSDPHRWAELRRRNLELQRNCFSWSRIAERYRMTLTA